MANAPPSEPSLPELPEAAASAPEVPYEEERGSTPPEPPAPERKLSPADEKLRAVSCAALMDPKVARVMRAIVVAMNVRGSRVDDLVNEVRGRFWEQFDLKGDWPQDVGRWNAIIREGTEFKVIDIFRKEATRAAFNEKVDDAKLAQVAIPPSSHRDRDDVREKASLLDQVELPKLAGGQKVTRAQVAAIADARMAGKGVSSASREVGLTPNQGHKVWRSVEGQFKQLFERRYGKAALAAATTIGGGVWIFMALFGHDVAQSMWSSDSATTVSVHVAAHPPTLRQSGTQIAADALEKADADCDAGRWGDCQRAVALASKYDPDDNFAQQISRLGALATDGLVDELNTANAKTGQQLAPQLPKGPKGK